MRPLPPSQLRRVLIGSSTPKKNPGLAWVFAFRSERSRIHNGTELVKTDRKSVV